MYKNFFKATLVSLAIISTLIFTACQSNSKDDNTKSKTTSQISLGETVDGIYTNTSFGIEMSYPKGWTLLDNAQNEETTKSKKDDELDLENLPILQLFTASSPTGSTIQMMLIKPGDGTLLDPSKYLESIMLQISDPSLGMKASTIEDIDLSGKTFKHTEVDVTNTSSKQHYYVSSLDDYIFSIITTSTSDDDATLISDCIKTLRHLKLNN